MKERKGEHPFGDAGQIIFLAFFLIVWILDSFVLQASTFISENIPLWTRLLLSGILVTAAGFFVSGGHWVVSQKQRPGHVVSVGVFGLVRHPLNLAFLLLYAGLTVATVSLFSLAVWIGIFIFYNFIAGYEEKLLELKFGTAYAAYKKKTGQWIHKITPRSGRD